MLRTRRDFLVCLLIAIFCVHLRHLPRVDATDAFPYTNDQATTISVARWFYWGQTADQVNALCNQNNARLTQIRVDDPNVPTFTVTMVQNTGAYNSGWWWYYGYDAAKIGQLVGSDKRLISIDPYIVGGALKFAVVMVPNTGSQARGWWWYYGYDGTKIGQLFTQNNARPIALRAYNDGGTRHFAVIMVQNTGVDYKGWEWWYGDSIDHINTRIAAGNRLIALQPDPFSGWNALLVENQGEQWWWETGLSGAQVLTDMGAHNSRLIDVSNYFVNNQLQFAIVELDDANAPQDPINAGSVVVHNQAEGNGWAGGYHASYFTKSSTASTPLIAENSDFRFEPASAIKVLYLLYTLKQGVDLSSPLTYYWPTTGTPDPNVCPLDAVQEIPANARTTTIENALNLMMQQSNNVFTRAFAIRWGLAPVQAMADSLGMTNTHLRQPYIGCGFRGGVRNELTLSDAAKLYSSVDQGIVLTGTAKSTFFTILAGGNPSLGDAYGTVVSQEAAAVGKSAIVPQFLSQFNIRFKPGGYTFCMSSDCSVAKVDDSLAGWMSVPFKSNGVLAPQSYVFGSIVNDLYIPCNSGTGGCGPQNLAGQETAANVAEAARSTIRQALLTW